MKSIGVPSSGSTIPVFASSNGSSNKGAIIGGVVGGVASLAILGGGISWFLRKRKRQQRGDTYATVAYPNLEISVYGSASRSRGRGNSSLDLQGDASTSHAMFTMHRTMNDELRGELDNLRRDLERIREERSASDSGPGPRGSRSELGDHDLPPRYTDRE